MAQEDRRSARNARRHKAWLRLDGGFAIRPCEIVDLSRAGVQVVVDNPAIVGQTFTLLMSRESRHGHACRVKWREGSRIGAAFESSPP
ncbi:MAG: PilZ domain-containing protein [Pseudorhodoplanes sp.]